MKLLCSLLHSICEICMALGGLGTVGTLVYMIIISQRNTKEIDTIQKIQSYQIETLYEPDIRIGNWSPTGNIVINNSGENLIIMGIRELSNDKILNKDGMKNWFPLYFDKGDEIHVPLLSQKTNRDNLIIEIESKSRLGLIYLSKISFLKGEPTINKPIKKN